MTEQVPIEQEPQKRNFRKILSAIFRWCSYVSIACLFISFFAPYVSPAVFWPIAFFGLLQPAFFFLNFLFLLWWAIRRKRHAFYSLAVLLFSLPHTWREFNIITGDKAPANSFSVMSYNVKVFDLYNWSHNLETRSKMFGLIRGQDPSILCIQEFYNEDSTTNSNLDSLLKKPGYPYYDVEYTTTLRKDDHWGVVTFSKFPIVNKGVIQFTTHNNNVCIYSDVIINSDTVRIYNMHLQSIALGKADYKFISAVTTLEDAQDEIESSKNILRRMKRAYAKRAGQAESIAAHMAQCPYPMIVCGDLNDTPVSYTYRTISSGLEDSFLECGFGLGKSFVNPTPVPRIDYIFHSEKFHAYEYQTLDEDGLSDHYPVRCKVVLTK
ncbi:MAG TPA: endonuclease/exonuclease/phosphatase family protein [Bacteroidia bacterium]|nr:endonuclease/exonuclease/phosphatase family protein [Bacteroidia bacterium]